MSIILKQIRMSSTLETSVLKSKFRGSLFGSLMGDCLGSPYEGNDISAGDKIIIQRYFDKLEDPETKVPFKKYTDDTAMMISVAKFLIEKPEPDYTFLAKLFVKEFFKAPDRGYGGNVIDVFEKMKNSKYADVFKPASEQFSGSGSYGNGGAMRIAPIPLYFHNNYERMIEVADKASKLTHTNMLGVNGAILQAIAIHQALGYDPKEKIDPVKFCQDIGEKITAVEDASKNEVIDEGEDKAYQYKMKIVEHLLTKKYDDETDDEVICSLGNSIGAHESVPTAIYCFLRALNDIPTIKTDNILRRTIQYAITLGGDTDTIACMAGAIAGAYLGEESVHPLLLKQCESYKKVSELADNLFEACQQS